MKNLIVAAAVAMLLPAVLSAPADAKSKIHLYFGVPYLNYQAGPDYEYRDDYGWYRPRHNLRRNAFRGNDDYDNGYGDDNNDSRYGVSCGEARRIVRGSGYRNVVTRECNGRTFTFSATRNGRRTIVYVNSRSGALSRG